MHIECETWHIFTIIIKDEDINSISVAKYSKMVPLYNNKFNSINRNEKKNYCIARFLALSFSGWTWKNYIK